MEMLEGVSRRRFLRGTAATAGAVMLVGCSGGSGDSGSGDPSGKQKIDPSKKGSKTKPVAPPKSFRQAPSLEDDVKAGKLPPLEKRLPESPYVPPHRWLEPGKYGGRMKLLVEESDSTMIVEYMYGHSLLRYLNDGLDVGPGLAETWEHNSDHSEWTFHFRKGLKWSDGHDWSTDDIMYWWNDMVSNEQSPEVPPDDVRSGKDTIAKLSAPDKHTLVVRFDAPAPATAEKLAAWTNRGNGAMWMQPKHYLKQFHPEYNKSVKGAGWATEHDTKAQWWTNPDCPTMTGWRCKDYKEGRSVLFERNPYYWCVDNEGNQLPYLDLVQFDVVATKTQMLQFMQGKVDFAQGNHHPLLLSDVADLRDRSEKNGVEVRMWDSGSGTGAMAFWNYDYPKQNIRELIREPDFRRALSHAFDRKRVRKNVYFNTGELTTGTLSPKGVIFQKNAEAKKRYAEWRDAYLKYDTKKANKLLDGLGLKKDSNGKRTLPDGTPLVMYLDQPADASDEFTHTNNLIKENWEAVGVTTKINPVSPDAYVEIWGRGDLMVRTAWEVGDNHPLIYPGWVVPVETGHWAPLHGQAYILQTSEPKKLKEQKDMSPWERKPPWLLPEADDPVARLWDLYARARVEVDEMKRIQLLWKIVKIHIDDGPFFIGAVANYPRVVLVNKDLGNVPYKGNLALGGWVNPWIIPAPAAYDPEAYFWRNPEEHP